MEAFLLEKLNIKMAVVPVDMNDAAITGARISMKGCDRVTFLVAMGASTAAVADFTLNQATAASAGSVKVLATANPYYYKVSSATHFTKVDPGSAVSNIVLSTTFASLGGLVAFEVLAEDLDRENDYAWVYLTIADSTAAKLASVVAICGGLDGMPGYSQDI